MQSERGRAAVGWDDVLCDHYDSDHPRILSGPPENWDEASVALGLAADVALYAGLCRQTRALELGAGTGRVTEALLAVGCHVNAVEPSPTMRARLRANTARFVQSGELSISDAIEAAPRNFDRVVMGFGVLACVHSRAEQLQLLTRARAAMHEGGLIALDVPNVDLLRRPQARHGTPTWVRTHVDRGARYARVASRGVADEDGKLRIHGSYHEAGREPEPFEVNLTVPTREYLSAMLVEAGFRDVCLANGPEDSTHPSPRLFAFASAGPDRTTSAVRLWAPEPRGIASTALSSAAARAQDARGDGLVADRYAVCLQGSSGRELLAASGGAQMAASLLARTAWFDDQIRGLAGRLGGLLNLGAGLCTRPLRLPALAGVQCIEVDAPELLRFKAERLACFSQESVHALPIDVANVDLVLDTFARLARPRLVLAEGLFSYLERETAEALISRLSLRLAPGELFLFDTPASGVEGNAAVKNVLGARGIPFHLWSPEDLLQRLPDVAYRRTHLGADDACVGLPRAPHGGTLLWRVTRRGT